MSQCDKTYSPAVTSSTRIPEQRHRPARVCVCVCVRAVRQLRAPCARQTAQQMFFSPPQVLPFHSLCLRFLLLRLPGSHSASERVDDVTHDVTCSRETRAKAERARASALRSLFSTVSSADSSRSGVFDANHNENNVHWPTGHVV